MAEKFKRFSPPGLITKPKPFIYFNNINFREAYNACNRNFNQGARGKHYYM
jgi:hypothetical protein